MERAGLGAQPELADGNGQVRDKRRVRGQGGAGRQAGPEPEARVAWWAGVRVAWRARGVSRMRKRRRASSSNGPRERGRFDKRGPSSVANETASLR